MPSADHQWLVVWLARRMRRDGFNILGADAAGYASRIEEGLPPSMCLGPIRPDVIAMNKGRTIAVGEAKTVRDISNAHTSCQLAAALAMRSRSGQRVAVYLAFPRAGLRAAARLIVGLGLRASLRIILVPVP